MTHKPDTARNASGMERVGKRKLGYNVAQVDAFLERAHTLYESDEARLTQQDIQEISFDLERNGYVIGQVDAALSRLERAVVDKCTEQEISECGRVAWKARAEELYRKLLKHAQRDYRERFDNGASRRPSYARKQVDIMVDQALDKIALMLGHELEWETDENTLNDINSTYVSNVIFTQKTGKHGYDERQVDYYLNACVRLLSSLESLKRLDKYVDSDYSGHSLVEAIAAASAAEDKRASAAAASSASNAPSFAPAAKVSSAASAASSVASSAAASAEKGEASNVLPKITRSQLVPNVPDHEKQSIFAPVDYNNQSSSDSFEALHQSERAIFTAHAAESKSANLEDEDSNDELLQSATVMHNSSSNTVPPTVKPVAKPAANTSVPPSVPPAFPPVSHRTHEAAESAPAPAPAAPASSIPSFPPAAPAKRASDSMQIPVTHLEPSKPLSLDIPDLSFPIIGHIDESTSFNNDSDNDDTNDDTSDALA